MLFGQAGKNTLSLPAEPPRFFDPSSYCADPHLAVPWQKRRINFVESARALFSGPQAPRIFKGDPYFRDCWITGRVPRRAFLASLVWHSVWVLLLVPLWRIAVIGTSVRQSPVEVAWYGPVNDLPLIMPAAAASPPRTPPKVQRTQTLPAPSVRVRADAFHPRQTILNEPMRPNHPRQTLIQPASALEPPKILPALPNIVQWNSPAPAALRIDRATLERLRPKPLPARSQKDVAAPEVSDQEHPLGAINIAVEEATIQRPALPVAPMSAPRNTTARVAGEAAPDPGGAISSNLNNSQIIALSDAPAPVAPQEMPAGNLSSRVAISPEGPGAGQAAGSATASNSGGTVGPPGLTISGGGAIRSERSGLGEGGNVPGSGTLAMPGTTASASAPRPAPRSAPGIGVESSRPAAMVERIKPGVAPEALLGPKHVYTLHVNMPNLTSATGSWILNFAELVAAESPVADYGGPAELHGPEPLRKVDPKYPPELRSEHVQGEVVLYAVIRGDGSVDSIQLVNGIDSALDANAMQALAQWKFRPAERKGAPVELEAIVHIPFRASAPLN